MKKTFIIGLVLFMGMFTKALSQNVTNKLEGVWQYCKIVKGDGGEQVMACTPIWKIFNSDGKFSQFMLMYKDGGCALTHYGSYVIESDSTYKEHITEHAVDKALVGSETNLKYRFVNDDMLELTYKLQGRDSEFREVWKRLKLFKQPEK